MPGGPGNGEGKGENVKFTTGLKNMHNQNVAQKQWRRPTHGISRFSPQTKTISTPSTSTFSERDVHQTRRERPVNTCFCQ